MLCRDIFQSALRLLSPHRDVWEAPGDYEDRASYFLSLLFSETAEIDKMYRRANGLGQQPAFNPNCSQMTKDFPLCDRFASTAAFYLAAMLILDENSELSDTFYDKYCNSISAIVESIPAEISKTTNVY